MKYQTTKAVIKGFGNRDMKDNVRFGYCKDFQDVGGSAAAAISNNLNTIL